MKKHIELAIKRLGRACTDLRNANNRATGVESLLLLESIKVVTKAERRLEAIKSSLEMEEE